MKMNFQYNFKDKVAIVTGASSGIGRKTAEMFCIAHAKTAFVSRSGADEIVAKLKAEGHTCQSQKCDVSDEEQVKKMAETVLATFGTIDILINIAAVNQFGKIEDISLKDWEYVLKNNLTSQFLCCKYVLPIMKQKRYGKIVNISSIAGRFRSTLSGINYVTSKAAIIGFTRQLAYEVGKFNINVNVLCPGQTYTPMLRASLKPGDEKNLKQTIPLGYIASPEQQGNVILFLASDESNYITGAVIDVNGAQI